MRISLPRVRFTHTFVAFLAVSTGLAFAGEPVSPLGKWMKPNMGAPLAGQDFSTLKTSLEFVASKPPPGDKYPQWSAFAKSGADAAAKSDLAGVKASCKHCHDAYKESYKKDYTTHKFP